MGYPWPLIIFSTIFWTLDMIKKLKSLSYCILSYFDFCKIFIILHFIIFSISLSYQFYHISNMIKLIFFSNSNQFKRHARLLLTIISNFLSYFGKSLSYCTLSYFRIFKIFIILQIIIFSKSLSYPVYHI